jgi:hypothetical protein
MKKNYTLILFLLIGNLGLMFSQENFEAKEKESIVKNKVKIQSQWSYDYENGRPSTKGYISMQTTYDLSGNILEVINYKSNGEITSVSSYTYNKDGDQTSWTRYKGKKQDNNISYTQKIILDEKGRKLAETGFDGSSNFSNNFLYDSQDRVVEIKYTTDRALNERRVLSYSANKKEMTIYNAAGSITSKEITTYDSKGNILEETKYIQNNVSQKSDYQYTATGKKSQETKVSHGTLSYRKKYIYDKLENLLKIMEDTPDGKSYASYIYQFNDKGFVIEERWTKNADSEYSKKSHKYNEKGLRTETDSYSASYKFSVLYKYTYQYF